MSNINADTSLNKLDRLCERGFFILSQGANVELPEYINSWKKVDRSIEDAKKEIEDYLISLE